MKRKKPSQGKIVNRRARYDYELEDEITTGIVLNGRETKALRLGNGHLRGAFVTFKNDELLLTNATIASTKYFSILEHEQNQSRKLLANKRQLSALKAAKEQGRSIVPLEFLTAGRYIKLKIAIGKGKKRYDKRQVIKKRDQLKDVARST